MPTKKQLEEKIQEMREQLYQERQDHAIYVRKLKETAFTSALERVRSEIERLRFEKRSLIFSIERMRVAGGSAEFQRAFDDAKALIARSGGEG